MPDEQEIQKWKTTLHERYENYLKTSFYFKAPALRESFENALSCIDADALTKGPFPEPPRDFKYGGKVENLAAEFFPKKDADLIPAFTINENNWSLYSHQEQAIRLVHENQRNVVVATGTASGKTESFLYPILFELYRQHLDGKLNPGVQALVLYPMNALANDQRRRLGDICKALYEKNSPFQPTFGQYTGETPEDKNDRYRKARERLQNEFIYRKEMREKPPHILLTNYSMLEYLLIRPDDSPLFDNGMGKNWQFIVLDEAHQYRGVRGMEMGMLLRRLKRRLRDGGRGESFRCIATSATLSTGKEEKDKTAVARFANKLFDEEFTKSDVIFGENDNKVADNSPQRFHLFMRALEGAFLIHRDGQDEVLLNRKKDGESVPIEIALCRECGQHYYVGRNDGGFLREARRDSGDGFWVEFYLPNPEEDDENLMLCRVCGKMGNGNLNCECNAGIAVKSCETRDDHLDQLKKCAVCDYRGAAGDPVQEIVHGADGPNTVIATALHGLLENNENRKSKILSFADSRKDAAFFAWYAQNSYNQVLGRNLILRALNKGKISPVGLSLHDLTNRMLNIAEDIKLFSEYSTDQEKKNKSQIMIFREMLTEEKRISLSGVGLMKWSVEIPKKLQLPPLMFKPPWNFSDTEARNFISFLLDRLRIDKVINLPSDADAPLWNDIILRRPQQSVCVGNRGGQSNVRAWANFTHRTFIKHFIFRLLSQLELSDKANEGKKLMNAIWDAIQQYSSTKESDKILIRANGANFRLNYHWLRVQPVANVFECDICASLSAYNIRNICLRNGCAGNLVPADNSRLSKNHYRILYKDSSMPTNFVAQEHTAQLNSDVARERQEKFKEGDIHLLSSSTTFEVGVDLGDLDVVFLRNVPPEPFNYTQRVGRAGRKTGSPGLALTYCRRNPHDLYHYHKPKERILTGETRAPQLHLRNEKIILRHMTAVALSAFFKEDNNIGRFKTMEDFIGGDWEKPRAAKDFENFCRDHRESLEATLRDIVPPDMRDKTGLSGDGWIAAVVGKDNNHGLLIAEEIICEDYLRLDKLREDAHNQRKNTSRFDKRIKTITHEKPLTFLSRKAIIPKYGFPVDVVELDVRMSGSDDAKKVTLQRDLSQAIAEYAPGNKIVANKKEWESCGIKVQQDKALTVKRYDYGEERNFTQCDEDDDSDLSHSKKYLSPVFGFVVPPGNPKEPQGRTRQLYTTRPYFYGFKDKDTPPQNLKISGIEITEASPASMVVLCEGKDKERFYLCRKCGSGFTVHQNSHKNPEGGKCNASLENFALGHEFVTDVVRIQFPDICDKVDAFSLAYAVLLGAARALDVPDVDLNVTITVADDGNGYAIVLYDNVPGGAGLVNNLVDSSENHEVFRETLKQARERVSGECGCDESCYGCLRSYRNQFAHTDLRRQRAHDILCEILKSHE